MLKKVVLPAPFGPMRLTIDPRGIGEVDVVHRDQAAELLPDLDRLENVAVADRAHARSRRRGTAVPSPSSNSALRRALGIRPSGRNSIISTSGDPEDDELVLRHVDRVVDADGSDAVVDPLADLAEAREVEPG